MSIYLLSPESTCLYIEITCLGDRRIAGFDYKTVVIDECTQATEPETLVPLVLGADQVCINPFCLSLSRIGCVYGFLRFQ